MSTSGNITWELQANAIVYSALRKVGALAEDQTASPALLANGTEALNSLLPLMVTKGMSLWKRTTVVVVPSATLQVYTVAGAVKIAQVVLKDVTGSQYPLVEKSLYDFNMLPSNSGAGVPVHYFVQPTLTDSVVSIWPLTADAGSITNKTIAIVYQRKFDGVFNPTDTLDFPSYWNLPIMMQLAVIMAPETGLALPDRASLKQAADEYTKMASDYGDEDGSLFVMADSMGGVRGVY